MKSKVYRVPEFLRLNLLQILKESKAEVKQHLNTLDKDNPVRDSLLSKYYTIDLLLAKFEDDD